MSEELEKDGQITHIGEAHDGKFIRVTVAHGERKKPTKAKPWDDRPTSDVILSKEAAEAFEVHQKVTVCLKASGDGEDLDDMQRRLRVGRD